MRTVTMHCTWTNEVDVEVPEDWGGDDPFQFADQVTARAVDLYDMEQA